MGIPKWINVSESCGVIIDLKFEEMFGAAFRAKQLVST
jgi:hypothetical protein